MSVLRIIKKPPIRTVLLLCAILVPVVLIYWIWAPGEKVLDGRHDLRSNGIWIQHGWLGDDSWFVRNRRDVSLFRDSSKIKALEEGFAQHGIRFVFPHLCPCSSKGVIASVDPVQTEIFLDTFEGYDVLPWIGGVLGEHCFPDSVEWRRQFVTSATGLLREHARLSGLHLNIEPMPSGDPDFLLLLDELREAMPERAVLSLAAYPPPTMWHPHPEVHWDQAYYQQVSSRVDQLAVMMYDTSIILPKVYAHVMSCWTREVLDWAGGTQVLLGVPAYDDSGVGYHHPEIENLENALLGIHAGLASYSTLPDHYAGISIYCEWEMDAAKWDFLMGSFERVP